jgi:hypothetical protein
MCRLVNFILLEPPTYSARNWVGPASGEKMWLLIQLDQRIAK